MNEREAEHLADEQIKISTDLKSKFFFHLSILAGATLALIVPWVGSFSTNHVTLRGIGKLKIAFVFLLSTLFISALRNYIASIFFWIMAENNLDPKNNKKFLGAVQKLKILRRTQIVVEIIAIGSFFSAIVILYFFLWPNLLV